MHLEWQQNLPSPKWSTILFLMETSSVDFSNYVALNSQQIILLPLNHAQTMVSPPKF